MTELFHTTTFRSVSLKPTEELRMVFTNKGADIYVHLESRDIETGKLIDTSKKELIGRLVAENQIVLGDMPYTITEDLTLTPTFLNSLNKPVDS